MLTHTVRSPFFTGPLRSPARLQNTFAHESFIDEIAAHVKADPVAYRLRHLSDPRLKDVVDGGGEGGELGGAAVAAARTSRGPASPAAAASSCVLYEGDNGYVAMVAEVDVDQATGRVHGEAARRRAGLRADLESRRHAQPARRRRAAGHEPRARRRSDVGRPEGDVDRLAHVSTACRSALDVPAIESVLINRPDVEATGAGETAITIVAAAIGNAIFDATGARIRQVPFTPERVKAALETVV